MRFLLGPGLLSTHGGTHTKQRKMLNPVFSGAHMRNLTPLFYDVADRVNFYSHTTSLHFSLIDLFAASCGARGASQGWVQGSGCPRLDGAYRARTHWPRRPGLLLRPARDRIPGCVHGICQTSRVSIIRVSYS